MTSPGLLSSLLLSTELALVTPASGVTSAVTYGYSSLGDGGQGTWKWDGSSTETANGGTVLGSGTGRWIRIFSGPINAKWFGAKGDDSTDDTLAIQAAIDYAISSHAREVFLPSGVYRITHTLHVGKSGVFSSVSLFGSGPNFTVSLSTQGTAIRAMHSDSPAINMQWARNSSVSDLTIQGLAETRMASLGLAEISNTTNSDTLDTDWNDSGLDANADSRFTPYAGLCVDGWIGTQPTPHYPTTWMSYGQQASSVVRFNRVVVRGFMVGLAVQPANSDANGDFVTMSDSQLVYNKWAISVGNGQSRNVEVSKCQITHSWCVFTTTHNGNRIGKLGSTLIDITIGQIINVFQLGSSSQYGPLKVQNMYGEAVWRIGDLGHNTSVETGIELDHCQFGLHLQTESRGIPATILVGGSAARIKINGGIISNYPSAVSTMSLDDLMVDGTAFQSDLSASAAPHEYQAAFHNATAGGIIFTKLRSDRPNSFRFKPYNIDTKALSTAVLADNGYHVQTNRTYCVPAWIQQIGTVNGRPDRQQQLRFPTAYAKSSFTSVTYNQDATKKGELVLVMSALTDANAMALGGMAGDVIWDDQTGMVFAIRDVSGIGTGTVTITAEAQTNYKFSGGVYTNALTTTAFSTSTGSLYIMSSRFYRPTKPVIVDMTSGSASLANCGTDDGVNSFLASDITADGSTGDRVFIDEYSDRWISPTNSMVTAISGANITMGGNAARTLTRKLLPWFIRRVPTSASR